MSSLYVHCPFCEKKCFYCSFVVAVGRDSKIDSYLECLDKEARHYGHPLVETVYLGGGTPSHLNERQLAHLKKIIEKNFDVDAANEFTLEANPEGLSLEKARFIKSLGINRVSLGIQTLQDGYLKYLGRNHDSRSARAAFENLRRAGFANINIDLMYSFPGQTHAEIEKDVQTVTSLDSEHLSLYTLTIEEKTRFHAGNVKLDANDVLASHYELVCRLVEQSGLRQYEVSNFSKAGYESRHNMNYWQGGDYIGLGVGAHAHFQGTRRWNVSDLSDYMTRMNAGRSPQEGQETLSGQERFMETVLFGLRMNQGIALKAAGKDFKYFFDDERKEKIRQYMQKGWL